MKTIWETSFTGWPQWDLIRAAGCIKIAFASHKIVWNGSDYEFPDNVDQVQSFYISAVHQQMFQAEVYNDPHWTGETDVETLAQRMHHDIAEATGHSTGVQCSYIWDIEFPYRDGDWLLKLFKRCRELRPGRNMHWTMEPLQGGWIKNFPKLVAWINADPRFWVVPQTFFGDMTPVDQEKVKTDILWAGFRPAKVKLFYDAAKPRPNGWDGELFHAERLVVTAAAAHHRALASVKDRSPVTQLDAWRAARYEESKKAA